MAMFNSYVKLLEGTRGSPRVSTAIFDPKAAMSWAPRCCLAIALVSVERPATCYPRLVPDVPNMVDFQPPKKKRIP